MKASALLQPVITWAELSPWLDWGVLLAHVEPLAQMMDDRVFYLMWYEYRGPNLEQGDD